MWICAIFFFELRLVIGIFALTSNTIKLNAWNILNVTEMSWVTKIFLYNYNMWCITKQNWVIIAEFTHLSIEMILFVISLSLKFIWFLEKSVINKYILSVLGTKCIKIFDKIYLYSNTRKDQCVGPYPDRSTLKCFFNTVLQHFPYTPSVVFTKQLKIYTRTVYRRHLSSIGKLK